MRGLLIFTIAALVAMTGFATYFAYDNVRLEVEIARKDAEMTRLLYKHREQTDSILNEKIIFEGLYEVARQQVDSLNAKNEQLEKDHLKEKEQLIQRYSVLLENKMAHLKQGYEQTIRAYKVGMEQERSLERQKWVTFINNIHALPQEKGPYYDKEVRINVSPRDYEEGCVIIIEAIPEESIRDKMKRLTPWVLLTLSLLVLAGTAINGWIIRRRRKRLFRIR